MNPYVPENLPPAHLDYERLIILVGRANAELARYDGLLQGIVNPGVLLSPLTTEEAVLSSKIEGTQATIDEVLEQEAGLLKEGEKYQDIQEIVNYRAALLAARSHLNHSPISLFLIRQMHERLLDSVRGQDKDPGQFRKDQNWIGRPGTPLEEATYVPPSPLQLQDNLEAWVTYLASNEGEPLIQTALIHAQFELLHPFKDGNGRIGRLLIPLYLFQKKLLSQPMFYLSSYLERNRETYYTRLLAISQERDWNGWIGFFLNALVVQATENIKKVRTIMRLYREMKEQVVELTNSRFAIQVIDALFDKPVFQASDFVHRTGIPKPTALSLLRQLKKADILMELRPGSGRRPAVLCFARLLNSAEGKEVFGV